MSVLNEIDSNLVSNLNSIVLCSDDDSEEDEDYDTAMGIKPRKSQQKNQHLHFDDYDDDDENYTSENNKENQARAKDKRKDHPDSVMKAKKTHTNKGGAKKTPNPQPRKRRRSSARFLRLSDRFNEEDDGDTGMDGDMGGMELVGGETEEEKQAKLGEMYRRAIRLNAENKINGGNSWGLNLIDNIDKFLCDENDEDLVLDYSRRGNSGGRTGDAAEETAAMEKRVNFTKASCTLDASVKIYSYRVDDVHLTSYKVLANLNRTDGGKHKGQDLFNDGGNAIGDDDQTGRTSLANEPRRTTKQAAVETIETNLSNINVSKLDAAYDIDPIFHKMSQKFDEGGAKGLLLVNLAVASDGCRIVLDSKEDNEEGASDDLESAVVSEKNVDYNASTDELRQAEQNDIDMICEEGDIDITEISNKLQELLLCSPLESIQLVPQLEELRSNYAALEAEGFSDKRIVAKLKSKRYANDEEEEKAAEESIRREALERSRMSGIQSTSILAPNLSILTTTSNKDTGDDEYASDDYGGGFDDDFDDHQDPDFDNFIATDDNAEKYASSSFLEVEMNQTEKYSFSASEEKSSNVDFLDAICQGGTLTNGGEYNFFDTKIIDTILEGNQWAGSAHWKKRERLRSKPNRISPEEEFEQKRNNTKRKRKKDTVKETSTKSLVDLKSCHKCLDRLLKDSKKTKGKRKIDSSQFTDAMFQKHSKENNILPYDAGMNVKQFSTLFMRPDAVLSEFVGGPSSSKSVVFHDTEDRIPFDDGVDDSYDDGPGFEISDNVDNANFAEIDDYVVNDLDDVRKVEKVRVKHATVAKKVDVKRLKNDLWKHLEVKTALQKTVISEDVEESTIHDGDIEQDLSNKISFQSVVKDIEENETQEDVSLAFYFICVLHLANEKCLNLDNGQHGLNDFDIAKDDK